MKRYHVYGIGNALLDIDFEVSYESLIRLNVDKGVMTLIDEERHHQLLEDLDGVKHIKACGGSAANTGITLTQLGGKGFYSCRVANDTAGDFFYHDLVRNGLDTNLTEDNRPDGITGKCIVMVTPDADRTMNTFLGITSTISRRDIVESALQQSDYVYIEGFIVAQTTGIDAAIATKHLALKHGVKTSLTLADPNMVLYHRKGLLQIIEDGVDLLFCNEREALLFCETDTIAKAQEILKAYSKSYVITLGEKGALIYDGQMIRHVPAFPTEVVDTVGAGDIFAGTFLYAITNGYNFFQAGQLANFAAAQVVRKFGPRLGDKELAAVKQYLATLQQEVVIA